MVATEPNAAAASQIDKSDTQEGEEAKAVGKACRGGRVTSCGILCQCTVFLYGFLEIFGFASEIVQVLLAWTPLTAVGGVCVCQRTRIY